MEPLATIRTVSHVAIEVADLDVSVDFYQQTLGMRLVGDFRDDAAQPNIKGLLGDFAIEIAQLPYSAQRAGFAQQRRTLPPVWLSLSVSDIPGVFERCKAAGLTDLEAPNSMNGAYFFSIRDPDGYLIELIELPQGAHSLGDLLAHYAASQTNETP